MWGKKEKKLRVQEELRVARGLTGGGSGEPITALNADLVPGIHFFFLLIGVGDVFVKDLTFMLYAIQNLGWGRDVGLCWLHLKLLFVFLAHF